jgi:hypothetical protein
MKPNWSIFDCRQLINFRLPLTHAHGTIAKADVAIAELGTDLGTKHRENDAHRRDG